jgi:hypothetical protein
VWWGEAADEPAREYSRPTESSNKVFEDEVDIDAA